MASGSSTVTIELPSRLHAKQASNTISSPKSSLSLSETPISLRKISNERVNEGTLPSPTTATLQLARWNHPRINMYRVFGACLSFMIMGMNDAAYGALIPYLEEYYEVDYTIISLVFLAPAAGYILASLTTNAVHVWFGQRGVAIAVSVGHIVAYLVVCLHPPYYALVIVFIIAAYGNGLVDGAWNAWVGDMANANEILGVLHSTYGLGGVISPLVATSLITKAGWRWYEYYYVMLGAAACECVFLTIAFWTATGARYRAEHAQTVERVTATHSGTAAPERQLTDDVTHQDPITPTKLPWHVRLNPFKNTKSLAVQAIKHKATLLSAAFLLVYVGVEVGVGGWTVTYMLRVRGASPFAAGMTSTGFWLGLTIGRLVLGFVTARVFKNEKQAVTTYIVICVGVQLLLWLVPRFAVSAVMAGLLGFFLGPYFPAAMIVMTKLLPKKLHVPGIGFAAACGAVGACVLPFAIGAIANASSVKVLQPIILGALMVNLIIWIAIPPLPKQRMA